MGLAAGVSMLGWCTRGMQKLCEGRARCMLRWEWAQGARRHWLYMMLVQNMYDGCAGAGCMLCAVVGGGSLPPLHSPCGNEECLVEP